MSREFQLSTSLFGHSMDIRAITVTQSNDIISGSRDRTAKYWKYDPLHNNYHEVMTYRNHENFVGSVLFLEPTKEYPDGLVITGGYDKAIFVYKPGEPFPSFMFKGDHTNTVCALSKGLEENTFFSASWDNTARYWSIANGQSKALVTFTGHEAAVWHVKQLSDGRVVTASADKTIGMWSSSGQRLNTLAGHKDAVRCLEDFPELKYFVSVGNDASVKVWSYSGENMNTFYGHTNFIYSIARCRPHGLDSFVTSDEDRTVRFWQGGENKQTIHLPAQSVWAVACLPNGDIVTGSSDGIIRVFTQEEGRVTDEVNLVKFNEEVNALKQQALQEIGGVKVSDLPGREALYDPGKRNGQMKMIRDGKNVVAYTWVEDGENSHWDKVGEVLGGSDKNETGKTTYEGKSYDFVFSVDVEDGKPPLKLPYNKGDDPYQAANKFLTKNMLPAEYLEQVVDFILKNSQEKYVPHVSSEYQDPFTGGSRYTPGSSSVNQSQIGVNLDPFTGGSSYSTSLGSGGRPPTASSSLNNVPVTASSSSVSKNAAGNFFPITSYRSFEVGDPNVILNKLKEFNLKTGDGNDRLKDEELEEVVKFCSGPPNDGGSLDLLRKLLDWPDDIIFPVLDVIRLAVRDKVNNRIISSMNNGIIMEKLKNYITNSCTVVNNMIVSLRTICNLCLHEPGENLVYNNRFDIMENFTSLGQLNKSGQVALATCLLNLTILTIKSSDEIGFSVLAQVLPDILTKLTDTESQFRTYVALGTLITSSNSHQQEIKAKINENSNFLSAMQLHMFSGQNDLENKRMNCVKQLVIIL
ncbi:phospholipase A2 activator protein [Leptinotarsa decemlineata]|uniref:phospholipase A2 activator protein n=1 Tax=Leptinotarsa decemlineata TaxID=7539 RepID=UPI000C2525D8|nr:phospholipase A-2-activating protein [Leptinotarsa decemlineata]